MNLPLNTAYKLFQTIFSTFIHLILGFSFIKINPYIINFSVYKNKS